MRSLGIPHWAVFTSTHEMGHTGMDGCGEMELYAMKPHPHTAALNTELEMTVVRDLLVYKLYIYSDQKYYKETANNFRKLELI